MAPLTGLDGGMRLVPLVSLAGATLSGGGGTSIIAAWAAVRNFVRGGRGAEVDSQRAALDAAELRDVEYQSMGMEAPSHPRAHRGWLRRLFAGSRSTR